MCLVYYGRNNDIKQSVYKRFVYFETGFLIYFGFLNCTQIILLYSNSSADYIYLRKKHFILNICDEKIPYFVVTAIVIAISVSYTHLPIVFVRSSVVTINV